MVCDLWLVDFYTFFGVFVFQGSLLVNLIMIDGSENRNYKGGFFACYWKAQ